MSDSRIYFETLLSSFKSICFDSLSNKNFSFEKLFYPLIIDEGRFAFQSYEQLMERARTEQTVENSHAQIPSVSETDDLSSISEQQKSVNETDDPSLISEQQKSLIDIVHIIEKQKSNFASTLQYARDIKVKRVLAQLNNTESSVSHKKTIDSEAMSDVEKKQLLSAHKLSVDSVEESIKGFFATQNLTTESDCEHCSLVINKEGIKSRILAVASAGHGKTTLLKRIAVF